VPTRNTGLRNDLRLEEAVRADGIASFTQVLTDTRILCSAAVWFCLIFGAYGIIFWMPLVLKEMTALGEFSIGLLSALPWLGVAVGMVLVSRHSDRTQERFRHVGFAALTASLALLASVMSPWHGLALVLLFVFGVGWAAHRQRSGPSLPPSWRAQLPSMEWC
jgi:ACS family tartrate transporter-like MFS transporter